jgi:hypothetical protein
MHKLGLRIRTLLGLCAAHHTLAAFTTVGTLPLRRFASVVPRIRPGTWPGRCAARMEMAGRSPDPNSDPMDDAACSRNGEDMDEVSHRGLPEEVEVQVDHNTEMRSSDGGGSAQGSERDAGQPTQVEMDPTDAHSAKWRKYYEDGFLPWDSNEPCHLLVGALCPGSAL